MATPAAPLWEPQLQSALSVPEGERDAEVRAFIDSIDLEDAARRMLVMPAGSGPRRMPPPSGLGAEAKRREALSAFIKVMRADYLCPLQPPTRRATTPHLMAYLSMLWDGEQEDPQSEGTAAEAAAEEQAAAGDKTGRKQRQRGPHKQHKRQPAAAARPEVAEARNRPLARVAQLYCASSGIPGVESVHACANAAEILADPVAALRVEAALAELEAYEALGRPTAAPGQPPPPPALLTSGQLAFACHSRTVLAAANQLGPRLGAGAAGAAPLTERQRGEVRAAASSAARALLALEPCNPKSWELAAAAGSLDPSVPRQTVLEHCLRAVQLGREQGRDFWVARGADLAVTTTLGAAADGPGVRAESFAAALDAYQLAGPALRRCKELLPLAWVQSTEESLSAAERMLQAQPASSSRLPLPAGQAAPRALPQLLQPNGGQRCTGCQRCTEELRRCSRCKAATALYCSVDCQKAHWATHKLSCKAAG